MKLNPNRKITMTPKELRKRDNRNYNKGQQDTLNVVNLFPLLALRDEFGFGQKRMERFIKKYQEIIEAYNEDYIEIKDVINVMKDEVKLDLEGFIS